MAVKQILTILDPSIKLDDMVLVDKEDPKYEHLGETEKTVNNPDDKNQGASHPFINIRSVVIELDELKDFEIRCQDFLPEVFLTLTDFRNRLTNVDFPLDGDLISVYIRPNDDDHHKSIRMDFDILNISRSGKTPVSYTFYGVLRVPRIFDEICQAKRLMTSYEALLDICDDLDLGFASNDESTEDRQTWLIAKEDRLKFFENIINYSYKNEKSFFTGFIDHNYFFNYINVQECFSEDKNLDESIWSTNSQADNQKDADKVANFAPFVLSNSRRIHGTNMYVSYYNPFTQAGSNVQSNGYRRYVQFYDTDSDELIEEYIEPLYTAGNENKSLLRGRLFENLFKTNVKYKYMGRQSSGEDGNVHPNYLFSRILNHQNLEEISKTGLDVVIDSLNSEILRYRRVPVIIYDSLNLEQKKANNERNIKNDDESVQDTELINEQQETKNEFLTGFYVCQSFSITWTPNEKFKTKARLVRREWNERGDNVGSISS